MEEGDGGGRAVIGSGAAALSCTEQCGSAVAAHRGCVAQYKEAFAKVGSSACCQLILWRSVVTVVALSHSWGVRIRES